MNHTDIVWIVKNGVLLSCDWKGELLRRMDGKLFYVTPGEGIDGKRLADISNIAPELSRALLAFSGMRLPSSEKDVCMNDNKQAVS